MATDIVSPQPRVGASLNLVGRRQEAGGKLLEIFEDDGALVQGPRRTVADGGHEPCGTDLEELLWLAVRVGLDVLVRDSLGLERDPDALDERAGGEI